MISPLVPPHHPPPHATSSSSSSSPSLSFGDLYCARGCSSDAARLLLFFLGSFCFFLSSLVRFGFFIFFKPQKKKETTLGFHARWMCPGERRSEDFFGETGLRAEVRSSSSEMRLGLDQQQSSSLLLRAVAGQAGVLVPMVAEEVLVGSPPPPPPPLCWDVSAS